MDTVMVLSILNGRMPVRSIFGARQDMRRTGMSNGKGELARGLTNSLTDSPEVLEKRKALYKRKWP